MGRISLARRAILPLLLLAATSCSTPAPAPVAEPVAHDALEELSLRELLANGDRAPGCKNMIDTYCSELYSPRAQGNARIGRGPDSLLVLQGKTPNDFTSAYFAYAKAKLRARNELPRDLAEALASHEYFARLERFLARRPREQMTLRSRVQSLRSDAELDAVWSASVSETVLKRLERRFPGYHRLKDDLVPLEIQVERRKVTRELVSEVSRSLWKRDRNWKKVETSFETLKRDYLSMIARLDVPPALRDEWKERIDTVRLVIPGALPEISDSECSTTQANAYYYPHLNIITVCAGDFNGEDILQTLAHELGHALDLERSRYLFEKRSEFGVALSDLRGKVCAPADRPLDCSAWNGFKQRFKPLLSGLDSYRPELPEFQRCLKRRPTPNRIDPEEIDRIAGQMITEQVADLAGSDFFLRITKDEIPLPNGKTGRNPNYLNPCSYSLWSRGEEPIDDELTQLLFFTAEYRCGDGDPVSRLRKSIVVSKDMATDVLRKTLSLEGEFSIRPELESEGLSSATHERFADVVGSYALAQTLSALPDLWTRRETFLAGSSWQCSKPSLASLYPEESSVQQAFSLDSHTEGEERRKEFFTRPVREAIGCEKDFRFDECRLPLRDPPGSS
jgi:hypothetical protein